jgi:phage gp46-like protein
MAEYGNNYDYGNSPLYKDDGISETVYTGVSSLLEDLAFQGDVKLFTDAGVADLAHIKIADRDLTRDPGIETAVLISLFTNRRAEDEDVIPDNSADKYGYWGDAVAEQAEDSLGSKLWLLSRHKNTSDVLPLVEEYAKESLEWMIEDGVADKVEVLAQKYSMDTVIMNIEINRPGEADSIFYKYYFNWKAQVLKEV